MSDYRGSVEVGPHWCGEHLYESVADGQRALEEMCAALRKQAEVTAMRELLMRQKPSLDLTPSEEQIKAGREVAAERDRLDALRSRERAEEIWAVIVPVTSRMAEELQGLPTNYWMWALAQLVGGAIGEISDTKVDAETRAYYLEGCIRQKLAEVFYHRENDGALRR
ncbi:MULTISPECIES: hypothetical protein [unclassified Mesorhizobium]|uniref:hypothetical protein n=1 Tax=unclassified Mesorhizobium TaxID=325217 RepID=UPI000FCA0975|nr:MULTISPECIES: hypothetical protein [unclassified Mesorhizobium]RUW70907.1 hypothetical protein EOA31_19170 [Mesorhizobium sp. M4B.F.Ca.ET.049.02.1.2]TGV25021.1 hypothetical protein EN786_16410 [Mesorhizobium sp. M4B.F.Ca.ET.143.01.1.1]